jgi:DNA-binding transcriptional regulator of glucitol operon
MDTAVQTPVWRFLLTRRWLGWHVLMVAACVGMLWLGDWQFHRAMSGNSLSWAYTFEWPLFSGFAVVFWAKTIRDEFKIRRGEIPRVQTAASAEPELPAGVPAPPVQGAVPPADDDPELAAYNAYLERLNSEVKSHGKWRGLR